MSLARLPSRHFAASGAGFRAMVRPRCAKCGNPFTRHNRGGPLQLYCSPRCQENAYRKRKYDRYFKALGAHSDALLEHEGPNSWDEEIAEAEIKIHKLQLTIAIFKRRKLAGEPWPGELGPF